MMLHSFVILCNYLLSCSTVEGAAETNAYTIVCIFKKDCGYELDNTDNSCKYITYDAYDELASKVGELHEFSNMRRLHMSFNFISSIPASICGVVQLNKLFLVSASIVDVPYEIGSLVNLEVLDLRMNNIKQLPSSINNLHKLEKLYLDCNSLAALPDICKLVHLEVLQLCYNCLTEIPNTLGELINLKKLYLCHNKLTRVPDIFKNMNKLQILAVYGNELKSLPRSVTCLRKHIKWINIKDTALSLYGEGTDLGAKELLELFGCRALLSINKIALDKVALSYSTVYHKQLRRKVRWNFCKLQKCIDQTPVYDKNMCTKLLQKIRKDVCSEVLHDEIQILETFILFIYIVQNELPQECTKPYADCKQQLGDILQNLADIDDKDIVFVCCDDDCTCVKDINVHIMISNICNSLQEIITAYVRSRSFDITAFQNHCTVFMTWTNNHKMLLGQFVRNTISKEKVRIFNLMVNPLSTPNNLTETYYRYVLRKEIGLPVDYELVDHKKAHEMCQDKHEILNVFYDKFTPEWMTIVLTAEMNKHIHKLRDIIDYLRKDPGLSYSDISQFVTYKNNKCCATEMMSNYILQRMRIIENLQDAE